MLTAVGAGKEIKALTTVLTRSGKMRNKNKDLDFSIPDIVLNMARNWTNRGDNFLKKITIAIKAKAASDKDT